MHPLTHYLKYHVLRYNARGVGLSSGWKSFTGLQEGEDLRELVRYVLKRLDDVRQVVFIVRVPPLPPYTSSPALPFRSPIPFPSLPVHHG